VTNTTRFAFALGLVAALHGCDSATTDIMGRADAGSAQDVPAATDIPVVTDVPVATDVPVVTDRGNPQGSDVVDAGNPQGSDVVDAGSAVTDVPTTPADVTDVPTVPADAGETTVTTAEITADITWSGIVRLPNEFVFVRPPAVLRILPGTQVVGQPSSALIITRGARIEAAGTAERPVVFTSTTAIAPGGTPRRGDWGGLVLLGGATINRSGGDAGAGENQIEGIDATDARGRYGGTDDNYNCGTLRYVRIDYAGKVLARDNELNSLTIGACGRGTTIDFVQTHRGEDDGVELFGGTVDLKHIVITQSDDDGLDWDFGWRGRVQWLFVQAPASSTESDPSGIEADNDRDANNATPRSLPVIYNATVVGPNPATNTMPGAVLRRGTGVRLFNAIITGWGARAVDVRDTASAALAMGTNPDLQVSNSLFFNNGAMGTTHFIDTTDNDGMFNEDMFFRDAARMNRVDVDPQLPAAGNLTAPNLTPPMSSPAATGAATPTDPFFDATATYVGAVRPGATTTWLDGWTSFR
jgi:hypothetical protein